MTEHNDAPVILDVRNSTGVVELNRPKALNSLNPEMVDRIVEGLNQWRDDNTIEQVLFVSRSPKAYCAGGDVRAAREGLIDGNVAEVDQFFADEYAMNSQLAHYPKPVIAVLDGIVMGGGVGISVHGSHRIVTDKTFASMPEMNIGYVTDVGAGYAAQRAVGTRGKSSPALAKFWALTGYRMYAADLLYSGLATHYVKDSEAVVEDIVERGIDAALGEHSTRPEEVAPLAEFIDDIEAIFGAATWEEISQCLKQAGNEELARKVAELTQAASPTSLVAAAELLAAEERAASVDDALAMENALGKYLRGLPDFREGVRAVLVDKTQDATFTPAAASEVDVEGIRAALDSL